MSLDDVRSCLSYIMQKGPLHVDQKYFVRLVQNNLNEENTFKFKDMSKLVKEKEKLFKKEKGGNRENASFVLRSTHSGDVMYQIKLVVPDDYHENPDSAFFRLILIDMQEVEHEMFIGTFD